MINTPHLFNSVHHVIGGYNDKEQIRGGGGGGNHGQWRMREHIQMCVCVGGGGASLQFPDPGLTFQYTSPTTGNAV